MSASSVKRNKVIKGSSVTLVKAIGSLQSLTMRSRHHDALFALCSP